jgi:hypothetical protein
VVAVVGSMRLCSVPGPANPLGPPGARVDRVSNALRRAVFQLSEGEVLASERISGYSSGDLAYLLEIERFRVKVGGAREPAPSSFRLTTIFRGEEDAWKILHRHADPITTPRPVESLVLGVAARWRHGRLLVWKVAQPAVLRLAERARRCTQRDRARAVRRGAVPRRQAMRQCLSTIRGEWRETNRATQ